MARPQGKLKASLLRLGSQVNSMLKHALIHKKQKPTVSFSTVWAGPESAVTGCFGPGTTQRLAAIANCALVNAIHLRTYAASANIVAFAAPDAAHHADSLSFEPYIMISSG